MSMYKFKIELGKWKRCSVYSSSDCLDVIVENWESRESGRFYFIEDCEFSQKDNDGSSIVLNGWRFSRTYQIHDAKKCWAMQNRVSEKFTINALTPDDRDYSFCVNDTIKGLDTIENLINTIYVISICSTPEDAQLMIGFIHDNGLLSTYSPDDSFVKLHSVKQIIIGMDKTLVHPDFLEWLKRLYKEKYKIIMDNLRDYSPSI